jgi:hypothetical protein
MALDDAYVVRVESLRDLVEFHTREVAMLDRLIARRLAGHPGYEAIQAHPGGWARRWPPSLSPRSATAAASSDPSSWPPGAGMTPRDHESDTTVRRGRSTKQGSRLVRWAAVEAAKTPRSYSWLKSDYRRIASRRGPKIAAVAVGRKIHTLVFYGLRDGEIRCLAQGDAA